MPDHKTHCRRKWTEEEVEYLKQWYGKKTTDEIARDLNSRKERKNYMRN